MSDLYRTSSSSTSSALSPESEALSSFLNHQLHNSSSAYSSVSLMSMKRNYSQFSPPLGASPTPLRPSVQYRLPSECLPNFPDPSGFFVADAKESAENAFPSTGVVDSDANTTLMKMKASSENDSEGCEAEVSDLPSNLDPPRSLSKRTRAAEVHNLSEKRRRSRINEKLKALQNLIPNSSKTDKASMLDEAIEYLKQLQLQVQMLSMRNGMSLHPLSLPVEVMRPMQLYQAGINPDIGNVFLPLNQGRDAFSGNEEFSVSNKCSLPDSKPITHSTTNIANSQTTLYGVGQQIQPCYGNFNLSTSSKDICRDATTKEQLDDLPQTGKSPSGAVS